MMHIENGIINPYVIVGLLSGFCLSASQLLLHSATKKKKQSCYAFCLLIFYSTIAYLFWPN